MKINQWKFSCISRQGSWASLDWQNWMRASMCTFNNCHIQHIYFVVHIYKSYTSPSVMLSSRKYNANISQTYSGENVIPFHINSQKSVHLHNSICITFYEHSQSINTPVYINTVLAYAHRRKTALLWEVCHFSLQLMTYSPF